MSNVAERPRRAPLPTPLRIAINLVGPLAFVATYVSTRQIVDGAWAMLAGTSLSVAVSWFAERRIAPLPMVLAILSAVFAGMALIFQSATFLKFEITVRSSAIGVALILALLLGLNPLRALFGGVLTMTDKAYRTLSWRFAIFSFAIALLNFVILRDMSNAVWIVFKFPGVLLLHIAFLVTQWPLISVGRRSAAAGKPPLSGTFI